MQFIYLIILKIKAENSIGQTQRKDHFLRFILGASQPDNCSCTHNHGQASIRLKLAAKLSLKKKFFLSSPEDIPPYTVLFFFS